jgi:hypothetical protein
MSATAFSSPYAQRSNRRRVTDCISLLSSSAFMLSMCVGTEPIVGQTLFATESAQLNLQAAGQLVSVPGTSFLEPAAPFGSFSAVLTITSRVRTTPTGLDTLSLQFSSDFAPAGGPQIVDGDLSLNCSAASYGTACSGVITATVIGGTAVQTFPASACTGGGGPCSSSNPNSITVTFTIPDRVSYKAGTYSTGGTFTISSI